MRWYQYFVGSPVRVIVTIVLASIFVYLFPSAAAVGEKNTVGIVICAVVMLFILFLVFRIIFGRRK